MISSSFSFRITSASSRSTGTEFSLDDRNIPDTKNLTSFLKMNELLALISKNTYLMSFSSSNSARYRAGKVSLFGYSYFSHLLAILNLKISFVVTTWFCLLNEKR
ncbi:unnamed protein product [Amoebophrya sp. A25]|nr:unnamed protein product [Amoebophrya sp. A25]|eukprot:GSA25T00012193001.1